MDCWDTSTKSTVQKIPLLTVKAGPREGEAWKKRLKEEYQVIEFPLSRKLLVAESVHLTNDSASPLNRFES